MSGVARIKLRISPNAKRSASGGRYGDGWKVRVAAPPEDGKANAELLRVLAEVLAIRARQVRIVSGNVSRDKVVAIEGLSADVVAAALAQASDSATNCSTEEGK
jgi:uncharacterized protein